MQAAGELRVAQHRQSAAIFGQPLLSGDREAPACTRYSESEDRSLSAQLGRTIPVLLEWSKGLIHLEQRTLLDRYPCQQTPVTRPGSAPYCVPMYRDGRSIGSIAEIAYRAPGM